MTLGLTILIKAEAHLSFAHLSSTQYRHIIYKDKLQTRLDWGDASSVVTPHRRIKHRLTTTSRALKFTQKVIQIVRYKQSAERNEKKIKSSVV